MSESELINFYYSSLCFPKLDELFVKYGSSSDSRMTTEQFQNFLNKEQGMDLPIEECHKFIKAFEQNSDDEIIFSKDGFINFMMFSLLSGIVDNFKNHIVYQKSRSESC